MRSVNERTGDPKNRKKYNAEQARIISDGIFMMERAKWANHLNNEDDQSSKVKPKRRWSTATSLNFAFLIKNLIF